MLDLRPIDAINILILLVVVWILVRVIMSEQNTVVWADFISTRVTDGSQRGDLNKVGQLAGIVVASVSVLMYADSEKVDPTGLSVLLGVALAYLGAVSAYASFLRSKQGAVETTKVSEPVATPIPPMKTTETRVENPPVARGS